MKRILSLLVLSTIMPFLKVSAQGPGLTFTQTAGTYTPISGGTLITSGTFDDGNFAVTLPQPFTFKGTSYSNVRVGLNGWISMGTTDPGGTVYSPISSTTASPGFIAPFGVDLQNAASGTPEIRWQQVGDDIIFQWQDVKRYTTASNTEKFSFQAHLNTVTGAIKFVYGDFLNITTSTTSPQVGIRTESNSYPTNVYNRLVNTTAPTNSWSASGEGTSNSSTSRISSTAPATSPVSGLTYTWTPLDCTSLTCITNISPADGSTANSSSATLTWNAAPGPALYKLYFGTTLPLPLQGTYAATTASITGLLPNTTYYWYVSPGSWNCSVSGCESNTTSFNSGCPPLACNNTTAPANGATVSSITPVTISWSAATNATAYDLYLSGTNPPSLQGTYAGTSTSVSLAAGTYFWYVVPKNSCGTATGCESNIKSFTVSCPAVTCNTTNTPANGSTVSVGSPVSFNWASATNATAYDLYVSGTNPPSLQGTYTTTSTTVSLPIGTYYWYVVPKNNCSAATGCQSNIKSFSTVCPPINCTSNTAPANGSTVTAAGVTLSWTAAANATSYDLYLSGTNPPLTLLGNYTTNSATLTLANGTYYWYVVPKNGCGTAAGCESSVTEFTVNATAGIPNDICQTALDLLSNIGTSYSPVGASFEINNGCLYPSRVDLWFKFKALATTAEVNVTGGGSPCWDPSIEVRSGNCNAQVCLGSNDAGSCTTINSVSVNNLTIGTIYYVRISANSGTPSAGSVITLGGTNIGSTLITLPLTLISFTGNRLNNDALLQWRTANELNLSHFELQRSEDGQHFITIGSLQPGMSSYSLADPGVFAGKPVLFYRLRSVDLDGRSSLSTIVKLSKQPGGAITIYPNPAKDMITISGLKQNGMVRLYSPEGRLLQLQQVSAQTITLPIGQYADGTYILQYESNGAIQYQKILKQ